MEKQLESEKKSKNLLNLLKELFEIIDVKRCGFVSFEELAQKWCDLPTENLPSDFLECLKNVISPDTKLLTFEQFLSGFYLSINKRQSSLSCASNSLNKKLNNYRLHRVQSEGKLQEISNKLNNDIVKNKNLTKKRTIVRTQTRGGNIFPTMGVNILNPSNNNNTNQNENNYFTVENLQKKTEYYSQPDITKINQSFDYFNNNNFIESLDKEIHMQKNLLLKPIIKTNNNSAITNSSNYDILMRPKKGKNTQAPLPPKNHSKNLRNSCIAHLSPSSSYQICSSSSTTSSAPSIKCGLINNTANRPLSINSAMSRCSSGMSDIQWKNSTTNPQNNNQTSNCQQQLYSEELQPQVVKHKNLLAEEYCIIQKGIETTQKLLIWFEKRVDSLEKRKKMLNNRIVALGSAVHEQKLNFYRAQILELTRQMKSLMANNEHGFPLNQNMTQDFENKEKIRISKSPNITANQFNIKKNLIPSINVEKNLSIFKPCIDKNNLNIKNNVAPLNAAIITPLNNNTCNSVGSLGSSSISSTQTNTTSSENSSPEPTNQQHLKQQQQIQLLKQQQKKLFDELNAKTRLIEQLNREKRAHEMQQMQYYNVIDKSNIIKSPKTTLPPNLNINAVQSHRIMPTTIVVNENRKPINDTLL